MEIRFNDVADSMDYLNPPDSLRELAARFRYVGIAPGTTAPPEVSLRALGERLQGPGRQRSEFLCYNTWLIQDNLKAADLLWAAGGAARLVACAGLSVAEFLASILGRLNKNHICDKIFPPIVEICGVSANPLNDLCKGVGFAGKAIGWLIGKFGNAIDAILNFLGVGLDIIAEELMKSPAVAGLFNHPAYGSLKPTSGIQLVVAPDIDDRAGEIGDAVLGYDVLALCEVWQEKHRKAVLRNVPGTTALTGTNDPKPGAPEHLGSGLLVFSPTRSISSGGAYRYKTKGVSHELIGGCEFGYLLDADMWACKGVQRTLVSVGLGVVEVYSTHLYSGGDLLLDPSKGAMAQVRQAQVEELAKFIAATHDKKNVALICGDFNIQSDRRADLVARLQNVGGLVFDDWYDLPAFQKSRNGAQGFTCRWGAKDRLTFNSCDKSARPLRNSPNTFDYYCADNAPPKDDTGERIDYIFVQRPTAEHSFLLDVSRIRIRAFRRAPGKSGQLFLSDHLGLEVSWFVSPK